MKVTYETRSDPFDARVQRQAYSGRNVKTRIKIDWKVKRRRKIAALHRHLPFVSSKARGQQLIPAPPLMHLMKHMVPLVLVLATLRYQGKPQSLLLENPASVWCFVAATCVYWFIAGEMKQSPCLDGICLRIYWSAALASGILSAVIVVSMLLPYPVPLVSPIIWLPLTLLLAGLILYHAYGLLHRGIISVIKKIYGRVISARGLKPIGKASLPV